MYKAPIKSTAVAALLASALGLAAAGGDKQSFF